MKTCIVFNLECCHSLRNGVRLPLVRKWDVTTHQARYSPLWAVQPAVLSGCGSHVPAQPTALPGCGLNTRFALWSRPPFPKGPMCTASNRGLQPCDTHWAPSFGACNPHCEAFVSPYFASAKRVPFNTTLSWQPSRKLPFHRGGWLGRIYNTLHFIWNKVK